MTPLVLAWLAAAPSLSNVVNAEKARTLPPAAREALARDGFVTVEGDERHFFSLYDRNAYEKVPSFISLDVVLHVFHVRFDDDLLRAEKDRAIPALKAFAQAQLTQALTRWPDAGPVDARVRELALFHATALKLLDEAARLDPRVDAQARDLAKTLAAAGPAPVRHPSCPEPLDATRFKPRGHYDAWWLHGYFRAFTFYAACAFPLVGESALKARTVALAALDPAARPHLDTLRRFVEWVGGATDSEPLELVAKGGPPVGLATDAKLGHRPQAPARAPVFRLLGGAQPGDAALFERTAGTPERPFPSALDVFAALGSDDARAVLAPSPALDAALRVPLRPDDSLAGRWLRVLALATKRPAATPKGFPEGDAWARRTLVAAAGSWAELKHDTLLYVKQPIVMMEGGHDVELPAAKVGGFVEARPDVYRALLDLTAALTVLQGEAGTKGPPESQGEAASSGRAAAPGPAKALGDVGPTGHAEAAGALAEFLRFLVEVAELELAGKPFPKAVDARLRTVGGELEQLSRPRGDESPPQALVADVFTLAFPDGPSRVLHVGTGKVDEVWVVVPRAGRRVLMRGGAFSYFEFPGGPGERLTDGDWLERLEAAPPPRPAWAQPIARPPPPRRRD